MLHHPKLRQNPGNSLRIVYTWEVFQAEQKNQTGAASVLCPGMPVREHSLSEGQVWKSPGFWQGAGGGDGEGG